MGDVGKSTLFPMSHLPLLFSSYVVRATKILRCDDVMDWEFFLVRVRCPLESTACRFT